MEGEVKDSEYITYSAKHIGNTEIFPLSLKFSPNGCLFAVLSDKDFVIPTQEFTGTIALEPVLIWPGVW